MLGLNTITLISSRVGSFIKRIVTDGLKMRLPFTSAKPLGKNLIVNGDFSENFTLSTSSYSYGWVRGSVNDAGGSIVDNKLSIYYDGSNTDFSRVYATDGVSSLNVKPVDHIGKLYELKYDVVSKTGTVDLKFYNGGNVDIPSSIGTNTFTFFSQSNRLLIFKHESSGETIVLDNITLREVTQISPDTSGNGNDAILKTGKCLDFDGANDGIDISNFSMYGSEGTFAFWCKPDTTTGTKYIIDLAENGDGRLVIAHSTTFRVFTQTGGSGGAWTNSPTAVDVNEWQRVVVTIDSSKNLKFYKNGVQLGSTQTANANLNIDAVTVAYIGRLHSSASSPVSYDGSLSDFQIYNKAWSDSDVAYDYANPQNLVTDNLSSDIHLRNLKAWWHLSEGSGSVIHDSAPLLGAEEVVNGDFDTDSDWSNYDFGNTSSLGWSITNGVASYDGTGSQYNRIYQPLSTVSGRTYKMTFTLSGLSNSGVNFGLGNWAGSFVDPQQTYTTDGTYTRYMVADRTDHSITIQANNATQTFSIDNVSVKEVFNVDGEAKDGSALGASWEDSEVRIPQLGLMNWSKGSNVLEESNDFNDSTEWNTSSGSVTLDGGYEAPDGTLTAWKVTQSGGANTGLLYTGNVSPNIGVVRSIWAKTVSGTGTVNLTSHHDNSNSLFTVTNEWQRFSATSGSNTAGNFYAVDFRSSNSNLTEVIIWGAQEEVNVGDSLSAFRKTDGLAVTNSTLIKTPDVEQFTGNNVTRNKDVLGNDLGTRGGALNLDGTGYAEVMHSTDFDFGTGDFSISAWVKGSYVNQGSSINVIFSSGEGGSNSDTTSLVTHSTNKLGFYCGGTTISADSTFVAGNWYHVVGVRDSGTTKLYVDKVLQVQTGSNTNSITNTEDEFIGFDNTTSRFYNDLIDDVQVYKNKALSIEEITQNYNATKSAHTN